MLGVFGIGTASAGSYYLQADMSGGTFNTLGHWLDQTSGGGNAATTFNGHDFFSNGFLIRTPDTSFTFGNASTTLTLNSKMVVRSSNTTNTISIATLNAQAGSQISAGAGSVRLNVTNYVAMGNTALNTDSNNNRSLSIAIGTLSGVGNLVLGGGASSVGNGIRLTVSDASSYTGDITWSGTSSALLTFDDAFVSAGGLIATTSSRINLTEDVSFARVSLAGVNLAAGEYSYGYLSTHETFGALFLEGGSGSITVIPESSAYAIVFGGLALAGVFAVRRDRRQ